MPKPVPRILSVYLDDPAIRLALERAAKMDKRSLSEKAGIILRDWLERKGYLVDQKSA